MKKSRELKTVDTIRESYTLPNRVNAYANQYAINNKRAGEDSALKVMDKKENQRQIS